MEMTIVKQGIGGGEKEEDSLQIMNKDKRLVYDNSLSKKRIVKKVNPNGLLVLNVKQPQSGESCIQESNFRCIYGLDSRIPKHIMSLDEKYLRHCLELIYTSALRAAPWNFPENLGSSNVNICDLPKFFNQRPLETGTGNVVLSPAGEWIVGSISSSKSIINILKSPLLRQFGVMENDMNIGRTDLIDCTKSVGVDFMSYPNWLSIISSQKLEMKMAVLGTDASKSEDQSSSSTSDGITRGTLQCTWNAGFPHYVFSVDEQDEVYVASLFKAKSPDDKFFDYMYLFHSRTGVEKGNEIHVNDSDLVGKMRVSTTFLVSSSDSRTVETEFVLFGCDESSLRKKKQTSGHVLKKNRGLSKKIVEVFKTNQPFKEGTSFKYGGTSVILENSSWNTCKNPTPLVTSNLSENLLPQNLELAAIIVKDHIRDSHREAEIGGWGLKFLEKVDTRQSFVSLETSRSGFCRQNIGDCCTSMDILLPASFHGGPRNRNGGPSSLTERWRSGGHCDCGGWDIGCPITILNTRPSTKADSRGDKSLDLFIQGSMQGAPIMKMVDIRDGLHLLHFQSTLSALQSFSIAVAILHTQTPSLQPKVYRS